MDLQQLSGIDASFLYLETPETPMHVAGLTYFELPPGFEGSFYQHFRKFFESRLHTIPIFSKRLSITRAGSTRRPSISTTICAKPRCPRPVPRRNSRK